MKTLLTTFSVLALATAFSLAEDKPPGGPGGPEGGEGKGHRPKPEEMFKKLDANADGSVSLDEFKAGPAGQHDAAKAEEIFKKIDADGNGSVNLEEFKAHRPPPPPRGEHGPGDKGGGHGPGGGKPPGGKRPGGA